MKKKKVFAVYIGDFRFVGEPMGKFYFNYDDKTQRFIMSGHEEEEFPLAYTVDSVLSDDDFILLELVPGNTGNPLDDEIQQLNKE